MSAVRPETQAVFAERIAERHGDLPALRFKRDGAWHDVSYPELRDRVRAVGRGLIGLGVEPGDRVAILAETCPDWTYAHFGVLCAGATLVPVYPSAGDEEVTWVLSDSATTVVICQDATQAAKIERLRAASEMPRLRHVVRMDEDYPNPAPLQAVLDRSAAVRPEDPASIVYTSGTTGLPKGCRLSHANFTALRDSTLDHVDIGPGDASYIYLPLAHLLAQLTEMSALLDGGTLVFYGGRIENIIAELAEARPTHLPSVPRLFEKVHAEVAALAAASEGGTERFEAAIRVGVQVADLREAGEEPSPELLEIYEAADAKLFGLVRGIFGGRLRRPTTGGAPIAPQTLDFMRACGMPLYEGYGMTETSGLISLNRPGAAKQGTVGRPLDGCEVRIAEDGEVLVRGPMVFSGYHANTAATADTLDADGWLHTGDLGDVDDDGYLRITGRKKDIIITSAGKNITPSLLEFAIQQSRWVSRAVMIGDRRPYPVALITLDPEEIARLDVAGPPAKDERVRALVQEAVDAANEQAAGAARVRAFAILDEDLSVESGELTPTLKVRRAEIARLHADRIEALYA